MPIEETLTTKNIEGILDSLTDPILIIKTMKSQYDLITTDNLYDIFRNSYHRFKEGMIEVRREFAKIEDSIKEPMPYFEVLKAFYDVIDKAEESIDMFFKQRDHTSNNFKEYFLPYKPYLEMIETASKGIKEMAKVYLSLVIMESKL